MKITILGNGSGGAFQGRNYTAHFLECDGQYFLLDCGEGTQHQAFRLGIPIGRVRQIFITHLHGDHVFGLIGLLTSFSLQGRTDAVEIFAPAGLRQLVEVHKKVCGVYFPFDLKILEVDTEVSKVIFENKKLEVLTIPLRHRIAAAGYLFREKPKPRHIRPEQIEVWKIPFSAIKSIQNGADFELPDGRIVPNSELTTDPSPSKSYAFCTDTALHLSVAKVVRGADLLYHESTFTEKHREMADLTNHSTASDAAKIAKNADVKKLLLGHFSNRYENLEEHLAEAQAIFLETEIAEEGKLFLV